MIYDCYLRVPELLLLYPPPLLLELLLLYPLPDEPEL
jgi:hypothetical protein